jgi:hypothetical protein
VRTRLPSFEWKRIMERRLLRLNVGVMMNMISNREYHRAN